MNLTRFLTLQKAYGEEAGAGPGPVKPADRV